MDYQDHIAIMNLEGTICENLIDVDYGSFRNTYELNESQSITFTAYRSSHNRFVFDLIICENFVVYQGEKYVIKQTSPKVEGNIVSIDVTAFHVMYEFQNHYVESNKNEDESSNSDEGKEYTLAEYLKYGFARQLTLVKFDYKIIGDFNQKVKIDELGSKNGVEFIKDSVELFGCIVYPTDTTIGFYTPEAFYRTSENIIRYRYNTDTVTATVSTLDLRTAIKVYGKKYTSEEKSNYSPIKTPSIKFTGTFIKEQTYRTEIVGAKATINFKCKFGDETIRFTIKKGKQGGLYNLFLDGKKLKQISCYAKSAQSETIDLIKHVEQGAHKIEMVFVGEDPAHPMPEPEKPKSKKAKPKAKLKPCMYVGTEKATVLNLIANNSGEKGYKAIVDYVSPNASRLYGIRYANSVTNEDLDNETDLRKFAKTQISDTPKTELDLNYISHDNLTPRDTVFFVHELMGYNTELKIVKLDIGHPFSDTIADVSFSNEIKDMVQIQQALNKRLTAQDNKFNYQESVLNKMYTRNMDSPFETVDIGSVLI